MRRLFFILLAAVGIAALSAAVGTARAGEDRELVKMPAMMQEHMLASMRDHLMTLGEIFADLTVENFDAAAKAAETRLGLSSFALHDSAHMAAFMPKPMQDAGTELHKAASRFAIVAQEADVERSYESMKKLNGALAEMVSSCNACHVGYRIR